MAGSKHFIVIGLGSFGAALVQRLHKNGCRVTGMDIDADIVQQHSNMLYEAIVGDATQRQAVEHLNIDRADAVVISMGEDITRSILATLHAKELNARQIVAKGVTEEHSRILKSLGVDRIVFPEVEIAYEMADRLTWPNVIDYLPIDPEYSFAEFAAPDSFAGKTLEQLNLRREFGVWIVGVKDVLSGKMRMFPAGDTVLGPEEVLVMVGKDIDIQKLRSRLAHPS